MSVTILSEAAPEAVAAMLPVLLTGGAVAALSCQVLLRSGMNAAYGSFALPDGFSGDLRAEDHLFVLVTEGSIRVAGNGESHLVSAGESFVLPAGASTAWISARGASALFSSCRDPGYAGETRLIPIGLDSDRTVSPPYAKDMLVAGDPRQSSRRIFSDSSGRWRVSLWASTPYHRKLVPFPKNELMYLHCGNVSFAQASGEQRHFDRNAPFIVAKGFTADWNSEVYVFKTACSDSFA